MSRKFRFHVGPRSPKEEDRIIRAVMREARDGDEVEVVAGLPKDGTKPITQARDESETRVDEAAEKRFGEGLNASLDRANAEMDQKEQLDAKSTELTRAVAGETLAEQKVREVMEAKREVKSWRRTLNEAGMKIVIEAVLKEAWASRTEVWDGVKQVLHDMGMPH